jgi:hydrogenase expression/formation protein HypD
MDEGPDAMKYLSEYRDPKVARGLVAEIKRAATRRWVLMEVCGGQTHTIVKQGLDELLGDAIEMVHGPGCPVCVTPLEQIDKALALASRPDVIFTSFGDMLRVPGSDCDLLQVRARGGSVRIVYSPLDALELARKNPDKEVVFFAVGFETTAPANAMAVWRAKELGVRNFSVLVSHVTVPPAMVALLESPDNRVQGFLAAGHVCTIMGWTEYEPIAAKYKVPIVVTGFEPLDILEGMLLAVHQLEEGRHEVENQYVRSVRRDGNQPAQDLVSASSSWWTATGAASGPSSQRARRASGVRRLRRRAPVRRGRHPHRGAGNLPGRRRAARRAETVRLSAFGTLCTPERPFGAPMVSSEGACAAYYNYGRFRSAV